MSFSFHHTEFPGLMIIEPHLFRDYRGLYKKYYEKYIFAEHGITCEFTESSEIISKKGVLRGLHYQSVEPQAKLLHVLRGTLFDVAVDLRKESPTFGKYYSIILDEEKQIIEFIPEGFAHGFITLSDETIFSYQSSGRYIPEACGGIRWDDPVLNILWPLKEFGINHIIATEKDKNWPSFEDFKRTLIS